MLVVVLASMGGSTMFLMLLVRMTVVLVILIVLKWLAQIHLHRISLMARPAVHHDAVALVAVGLIVHAVCLGGLRPWRPRRRRCVVAEGYATTSCRRPHSTGEVAGVEVGLCVLRIEGLASSPLVGRVFGHLL